MPELSSVTASYFRSSPIHHPDCHAMLVTNTLAGLANGFAQYRCPFLRRTPPESAAICWQERHPPARLVGRWKG